MQHAFSGIKVLGVTSAYAAPFAAYQLALHGADVINVEEPGKGDYARTLGDAHAKALIERKMGAAFLAHGAGKMSLTLNLRSAQGKEIFLKLARDADVIMENQRAGSMDGLGLGYEDVRRINPRIIYCSLTGYGQTGPLAHRAGHDLNYLARSGVLGMQGPSDAPPQVPGFQLADISGALWSVIAVLGALRERERTGAGAVLDVAMADGSLGFASFALGALFSGDDQGRGRSPLAGAIAPYGTYLSSDGQPVTLAALEPKFWSAFCAGAGIETDMTALLPGPHQDGWRQRLRDLFATRSRDEWAAFGARHDCCVEPVLRPDELRADPHLAARQLFFDLAVGDQRVAHFRTPISPLDLAPTPAPPPGQHTDAILAEAGLEPGQIAALRGAGVVR